MTVTELTDTCHRFDVTSWLSPNWLVTDMVCHRFDWHPFSVHADCTLHVLLLASLSICGCTVTADHHSDDYVTTFHLASCLWRTCSHALVIQTDGKKICLWDGTRIGRFYDEVRMVISIKGRYYRIGKRIYGRCCHCAELEMKYFGAPG